MKLTVDIDEITEGPFNSIGNALGSIVLDLRKILHDRNYRFRGTGSFLTSIILAIFKENEGNKYFINSIGGNKVVKKIAVEIDADDVLCGNCFLLAKCPFGKPRYIERSDYSGYERLEACRESEDLIGDN
jgi:hypothetical protein